MQQAVEARTPAHLWIVGVLATLWNAFGAYDYVMTRMRNTDYFQSMMPDVDPQAMLAWVDAFPLYAQVGWAFGVWGGLAWVDAFPLYAQVGWALGVWGGLAGSILLLLKSRWAVWAFAVSLIGAVLGLGYQLAGAPPLPGAEGAMFEIMPYVILLVAALLVYYAWSMEKKGVLR